MSCTVFMTSSLGCVGWDEVKSVPCPQEFDDANGLLTLLEERWPAAARFLFVASYEGGGEQADEYAAVMARGFEMSGLPIANVTVLDGRNPEVVNLLDQFDVIFLSGGHYYPLNLKRSGCCNIDIPVFSGIIQGFHISLPG